MNSPPLATTARLSLHCGPALRSVIAQRLRAFALAAPALPAFHTAPEPATPLRRAAVCLAVIETGHGANLDGMPHHKDWNQDAALLLTRRAGHMRRHSGQWALPGGRMDEGETPEQAALREMQEEVHLQLDTSAIVGRLDDFVTRSGFQITPVVVWAGAAQDVKANPEEVASLHRIPCSEFLRADGPMLSQGPDPDRPVLKMPVGNNWIAAPTAALIYQFREVCLLGRETRVGHFDQPAFAWK